MSDLEIGFKLFDQMIVFWQFYVGGLIGVVGWVFAREHAWPSDKRIGIAITFLLFSLINMSALYKTTNSLTEMSLLLNDASYEVIMEASKETSKKAFKVAAKRLDAGAWYWHIVLHLIADMVAVYFVIILAKKEPKKS